MTLRTRTEIIRPTDTVQLTATFRGTDGDPLDPDSTPEITLISPDGLVMVGPTSDGMMRLDTGRYQFNYSVSFAPVLGVYADIWQAEIEGFRVEATFNFVVDTTNLQAINTDGYYSLGDEVGFDYTQEEIFNINKLLKTARARLNSRGKVKTKDSYGNIIYVDCDIFNTDTLVTFLANSVTMFNEIPHWTSFTFADTAFVNQFHEVLVEGAVIWALASHALIARGAEYQITDQGVNFQPPSVSELLSTQWSTMLTAYNEKIKFIKNSFKPHPMGLGSFSIMNGNNTQVRRLRHLRQRQMF